MTAPWACGPVEAETRFYIPPVLSFHCLMKISLLVNKTAAVTNSAWSSSKNLFCENRSIPSQGISSFCAHAATDLWGNKVAVAFLQDQYFCCHFLSGNTFFFLFPQKEKSEAVFLQSSGDKDKVTHCSKGSFGWGLLASTTPRAVRARRRQTWPRSKLNTT